jgi:hypothetical protein
MAALKTGFYQLLPDRGQVAKVRPEQVNALASRYLGV